MMVSLESRPISVTRPFEFEFFWSFERLVKSRHLAVIESEEDHRLIELCIIRVYSSQIDPLHIKSFIRP